MTGIYKEFLQRNEIPSKHYCLAFLFFFFLCPASLDCVSPKKKGGKRGRVFVVILSHAATKKNKKGLAVVIQGKKE